MAPDPRRPLDLSRGPVVAEETAELLLNGLQRTNRVSLEVVLSSPEDPQSDRFAAIIASMAALGSRNSARAPSPVVSISLPPD